MEQSSGKYSDTSVATQDRYVSNTRYSRTLRTSLSRSK